MARINILEPYEVRYWSNRFGCTEHALKAAVADVGTMAHNVEEYLRVGRWRGAPSPGGRLAAV
jgi:hypothetical protein